MMEFPSINTELLPPPQIILKINNVNVFQWGWSGIDLNRNLLKKYEYNIDRLLFFILKNSNGVYFILIEDVKNYRWLFFSDLYSCKKIFYLKKKNALYLTDFLYKFKNHIDLYNELDNVSLALYLMYGFIPTNDTLYKSVKSLKPFTYYEYKENQIKEHKYFDIDFVEGEISYEDAVSNVFKLFEKCFIALTQNFNKFIIPLSGGRDSRFLFALALKHFDKEKITTFTFGQKGTYDYEIGQRFAKKYKIKSILLPFRVKDYYENYIVPATKFKNGLLNHAIESPAKFYEQIPNIDNKTLIISGFIGDAVLSWSHEKEMMSNNNDFKYPKTTKFGLKVLSECLFFNDMEIILSKLRDIVGKLCDKKNTLVKEKWLYYNHVPFFTNPCMFSEEKDYNFVLPFVERVFFDFVRKIPVRYKKQKTFYEDIVRNDNFIYSFFKFPLKTYRGIGYGNNRLINCRSKFLYSLTSLKCNGHPMKNYINFEKAYSDDFLKNHISYLYNYDFLKPILSNWQELSFRNKTLLLSLNLNLKTFFT